jgi:hypothetical protein
VVVATALAALLASACAGGGPTSPAPPTSALGGATADPGDIDPALLEPLTALGPCEVDPNAVDAPAVDGLVLPPDAVLTEQTEDGPLTTAQGYVPMTPVQLRVWYQRHDDLEVVQIEDEIREAEALLDHGDRRLFVKAQAVCELGSIFIAVVAPRAAQDQVPAPAGGAGG